ncbi:peptidylprolyl isomerase [Roseivirga sp. BDSF3-8]|uniref:FKBP-type peptidyl-prolyl cis-trans isomerase n=1 Tax=Roseivirga sp. BDSF3-8 TaxID=3241598 RepID=UPI003531AE2B
MSGAKQGDKVKVHYTGKLQDGTVFDSSENRDPLEFTLGNGQMIPGFEQAVNGMAIGDEKTAEIAADDAYGQRQDNMMVRVPKEQVPSDIQPEVGQQLAINQGGQNIPVVVTEVTEAEVVLDANHPLAGKDLVFDIKLMEIS